MMEIILCLVFEPESSTQQADMSPAFSLFGEVGFRNLRMCKAEGYDSDIEDSEASPSSLLLLKIEKIKKNDV